MQPASASPSRTRILRDLLMGACLGVIGIIVFWQLYPGFWKEPPLPPQQIALQHRQALQAEAQQQAARAMQAAVQPVAAPAACDLEPLITPGSAQDGRATTEHPFPGDARAKAKVFLRQAETAAAQGRPRDAEVALLAACRENDKASGRPTVPLARVLGKLGDRYVAAAGAEESPMLRGQLMARARHVVRLSAQAYATTLGPNASRSRMARERLASLEQELVAAADAPQARDQRAQAAAAAPARAAPTQQVRAPPPARQLAARQETKPPPPPVRQQDRAEPAPQRTELPPGPQPAPVRAGVANDPELRQLAADLARLRAQAQAVSEDPAGFSRRADIAQAQRDRCQDAACLREWYGKRRRELLAEF